MFSYFICFVSLQFLSYVYTYLVNIKSALLAKLTFKKWPVNYLPSVYFQQRYFFHEFQEWEQFFSRDDYHFRYGSHFRAKIMITQIVGKISTCLNRQAYFKELQMNPINLNLGRLRPLHLLRLTSCCNLYWLL